MTAILGLKNSTYTPRNTVGRKTKNIFFSINNYPLEIVQEYTYLGVKLTTSGSFNLCQKTLAEKGLNALYKFTNKFISFA